MAFFLSRVLFTPPKTPRNVFFPWQTFSIHRTGAFLERRRVALKVPVNLTKFEIKSYLEKIYNARVLKVTTLIHVPRRRRDVYGPKPTMRYYRVGCIFKKAIVTLEDPVPDEVKMLRSSIHLARNPDITKHNVLYSAKRPFKPPSQAQRWEMGECKYAWRLPIPNLLAGEDLQLNPTAWRLDENHTQMLPDFSKPFFHNAHFKHSWKPDEISPQPAVKLDITPWRRRLERLRTSPSSAASSSSSSSSGDFS